MDVSPTTLPGVLLLRPKVFPDQRGLFFEAWSDERYKAAGIEARFRQDNISVSASGVLRGLHFQRLKPQAKLVTVLAGKIYDVCVDLRRALPTFGQWYGRTLDGNAKEQIFIPAGLAHGFCVVGPEPAIVLYKAGDLYDPADEGGVNWSDADLGIAWPIPQPMVSDRDRRWPKLRDLTPEALPRV